MCFGEDTVTTPVSAARATDPGFSFKKGDKVRILRRATTNENGWNNAWASEMDKAIGQVGTVSLVIAKDKDVTVEVPGIRSNYGYPTFALELVNESLTAVPAATVTTVTTKKRFPVVGDRVEIPASLNHVWAGQGVVTRVYEGSSTITVKMETGTETGIAGGFDKNKVILITEPVPTTKVVSQTEVQPTPVQSKKVSALEAARSLAVSLAKQNPAKTVTIDWVQDELTKQGYTSADLGNAAGIVFKGEHFKNTGTAKSVRPGNNRRRITVWQYTGDTVSTVTPTLPSTAPAGSFVVQVSRDGGQTWERSLNKNIDGRWLSTVVFSSYDEAMKEAQRQQKSMGISRYLYQAAPFTESLVTIFPTVPSVPYIVEVGGETTSSIIGWRRSANAAGVYPSREEAEEHVAAQHAKNGLNYRSVPFAVESPAPPQQFIVETSHDNGKTWERSRNSSFGGKNLFSTGFPTLEKAQAEANRHSTNKSMQNSVGRPYRAVSL